MFVFLAVVEQMVKEVFIIVVLISILDDFKVHLRTVRLLELVPSEFRYIAEQLQLVLTQS